MNTLRVKILAAFLAGILSTLGVLTVRDFVAEVRFRIDRIEQFLTQQEMLRQGMVPQSAPQLEKGLLREPQRMKV